MRGKRRKTVFYQIPWTSGSLACFYGKADLMAKCKFRWMCPSMDVTYHGTYAECGIWNWKHVLDMPSYIVTLTLHGITYTTSENAAISNGPIHC